MSSPRRTVLAAAVAASLALTACAGPVVEAEDAQVPEQLALDDETTTTKAPAPDDASATTEAEPSAEPDTSAADPAPTDAAEPQPSEAPAPADPAPADPAPADPAPADPAPADPAPVAPAGDADDRSFELINELRVSKGLAPLTRVQEMDDFAREWSTTMGTTGNFEHSDAPYGENIAFASDVSQSGTWAAELFNTNWINSPGHYANMTNPDYTTIGVGIVLTDAGWYGTHVFK